MAKINFLKIRNNSTIVWDKKYGFDKIYLETSKIKVLTNGDVIGTGWYWYFGSTGGRVNAWIIRTDSAGNEKWYREYALLNGIYSENFLWNMIQTTDGGFAACGYVIPLQPDTGTQDTWVLKVDSLGCESPGNCWVGIDEIQVKTFTPDKPFVAYPNPVSAKLTVEFHNNPDGVELEMVNIFGNCCLKVTQPPQTERIVIDTRSLKTGIYFLKIIMGTKIYTHDKIIVSH
jgi:hypothetical protein